MVEWRDETILGKVKHVSNLEKTVEERRTKKGEVYGRSTSNIHV
jgi:hypothetical protein